MARIQDATIEFWTVLADNWLAANTTLKREDIKTGADAWSLANRCGILERAYTDRDIVDAHIQTALQRIMPRAVFKDAKRY